MKIFNVVNSFIGKKGNIGLRTDHILHALDEKAYESYSFSRGHVTPLPQNTHKQMGWAGHIPRLLNAYRIYLHRSFNHRLYDIKWFETFFFRTLRTSPSSFPLSKGDVAHVWDYSPAIIEFLQQKGMKVLLDIPIAPMKTIKRLAKLHGKQAGLTYFHKNGEARRKKHPFSRLFSRPVLVCS